MGYTVSQIANMCLTIEDSYLAELRDAASAGGAEIITALHTLSASCNGLVQAQAKASAIIADPRWDRTYKLTQARQLVTDALDAAQKAVVGYTDALDGAQSRIQSALVPKPPANTDGSVLALRAQEVIKLLEATDPMSRISTAVRLFSDALANKDTAKAYILAGGQLLTDTYARLGMKADALQAGFARAIGAASATGEAPAGAKLLALLTGQGGSTMKLRGFRDLANLTIYNEVQGFNRSLESYVALGVIQNGPTGGTAPAPSPATR